MVPACAVCEPRDAVDAPLAILLAEDSATSARALAVALDEEGGRRFRLTHADSLQQALARLGEDDFDLVLLDLGLRDSWGLETLDALRTRRPEVPVVVLTGSDDEALAVQAVQRGAQDYLVKARLHPRALIFAILSALERHRAGQALLSQARRDALTGLLNRRGFLEEAERWLGSRRMSGEPAVLFFLDVDGLKTINDRSGHGAGDELLQAAADVIRSCFRGSDIAARLGGDEFAVLAAGLAGEGSSGVVERLRTAASRRNRVSLAAPALSFSVGTAECRLGEGERADRLLAIADAAMYRDKTLCRDKTPYRDETLGRH